MTAASVVIDRVRSQLIDEGSTKRWSDTELLRWLTDAQRVIVANMPSASTTKVSKQLVAGTRQTIPADGHMLLTVFRNMGTTGTTAGRACRIVSRELLDAFDPDWHTATASATTQNYLFDPAEGDVFYVYPPSTGTNYLELTYVKIPTELTATTDALTLSDLYLTPLFDYVMYRAHQKDSDFAAGQALSQQYMQAFMLFLGQSGNADAEENPNLQMTPFNPAVPGAAK